MLLFWECRVICRGFILVCFKALLHNRRRFLNNVFCTPVPSVAEEPNTASGDPHHVKWGSSVAASSSGGPSTSSFHHTASSSGGPSSTGSSGHAPRRESRQSHVSFSPSAAAAASSGGGKPGHYSTRSHERRKQVC